jgi:hypothetical protein
MEVAVAVGSGVEVAVGSGVRVGSAVAVAVAVAVGAGVAVRGIIVAVSVGGIEVGAAETAVGSGTAVLVWQANKKGKIRRVSRSFFIRVGRKEKREEGRDTRGKGREERWSP